MFAHRPAQGGQRAGSDTEQCPWKLVGVDCFAQGHFLQYERKHRTCNTAKASRQAFFHGVSLCINSRAGYKDCFSN